MEAALHHVGLNQLVLAQVAVAISISFIEAVVIAVPGNPLCARDPAGERQGPPQALSAGWELPPVTVGIQSGYDFDSGVVDGNPVLGAWSEQHHTYMTGHFFGERLRLNHTLAVKELFHGNFCVCHADYWAENI